MMKLNKVALALSSLLVSGGALAHGYLTEPPSRDLLCQKGVNTDCGNAAYEPQSVGESTKGFPGAGTPPDGKLASGDNGNSEGLAAKLNEQTSDRWAKNKIQAGEHDFSWHFTAMHATQNWKYFITKPDWNPNKVLTRDSFELTPFCVHDGKEIVPPSDITHSCTIPERSGYHVIYANWEVSNTTNTFYKMIDVEFEDTVPSEWKKTIGTISPKLALKAGDSVKTRVFGPDERPELSTTLNINSDAEGDINIWSKALAARINAQQPDLRAGQKNNQGKVNPVEGMNTIYTRDGSGLTRVEIELDTHEEVKPVMEIGGVKNQYTITDGHAPIELTATVTGEMVINAKLFDKHNTLLGFGSETVKDGSVNVALQNKNLKPGNYTLTVVGITRDQQMLQQSFDLTLSEAAGGGDYQFTYPENIKQYVGGTKVLQPKDGKVYECKKGQTSGWCTIYAASANHYEPGVGGYWKDAWSEVGTAAKSHKH